MAEVWDQIQVEWLPLDERALQPKNAYGTDAGWDLHVLEDTRCASGSHTDVRTGVAICLPNGFFARIVGRSSAFRKRGVIVLEGIIDAGFTGELFSSAYVPGWVPVDLKAGESIAQLIIQPVIRPVWSRRAELSVTPRGANGFGSSGR